ncbi:MAG: PilZ domain-containing protein [Pseudomonadota bacterium]
MHQAAQKQTGSSDLSINYQRVQLNTLGRYMLANRSEFACEVFAMSPGDLVVRAPVAGEPGERVILYLDHIGRIQGEVDDVYDDCFVVAFDATKRKRDVLAAKLTWLANRHELSLPEDRRHDRIIPLDPIVDIILDDGRAYKARLTDLSLSGAAVEIDVRPALGTRIMLGKMASRVVRHSHDGIALEFANVQRRDTLESFLRR